MSKWMIYYLLFINAATFLAYGSDKLFAKLKFRRISERTLHVLSLLSGWPGAMLGQKLFRHKTVKKSFRTVFWLTVAANVTIWGLWWWFFSGATTPAATE